VTPAAAAAVPLGAAGAPLAASGATTAIGVVLYLAVVVWALRWASRAAEADAAAEPGRRDAR
jgi:hypothetical protein